VPRRSGRRYPRYPTLTNQVGQGKLAYMVKARHEPTKVNVQEAKTHLSRLLARVEAGDEIVIARDGRPIARLVSVQKQPLRMPGSARGEFSVPDDFDAPLPDEIMAAFR